MKTKWMILGALSALLTGALFGQDPPPEHKTMVFTQTAPAPPPGVIGGVMAGGDVMFSTGAGPTVHFMSAEMSFEGSVVKGAPYSAEAVTETTQTLSDGNRIARKTSSPIYRDGEGRTRREQSLPAIGPWATSGTPPVHVFINDPVSGVNYILESNNKIARKMAVGKIGTAAGRSANYSFEKIDAEKMAARTEAGTIRVQSKAVSSAAAPAAEEKLPSQLIEGVQAEGTRSTITIPAGEVGNDRPIQIVSERWYSPELKTVVMSKHSDPRMGETVYKLTGLQRAEPAHSLFEVPADYTVQDGMNSEELRQQKIAIEKMITDRKQE
jgi:hypothetical protein